MDSKKERERDFSAEREREMTLLKDADPYWV